MILFLLYILQKSNFEKIKGRSILKYIPHVAWTRKALEPLHTREGEASGFCRKGCAAKVKQLLQAYNYLEEDDASAFVFFFYF